MKGYELYSWQKNGEWHFALITGTNRNKSLEEIILDEVIITESGWVHIHVVGTDSIKSVLNKLVKGEDVLWLAGLRVTPEDGVDIILPNESFVNSISDYAIDQGLNFSVEKD
jgi:hypothetical protein